MVWGKKVATEKRLLESRLITEAGCWIFTGYKNYSGYGIIRHEGKVARAHVVAYKIFVGEPKGNVCHKSYCTSRACFNPEHLYDGDQKSNYEDSVRAGTHYNTKVLDHPRPNQYTKKCPECGFIWDGYACDNCGHLD